MKRFLVFLLGVATAAVLAFAITRWIGPTPLHPENDSLAWIEAEFHLSPAQVAAVKALHDEYQPVCREHCLRIAQARARLAAVSPGERDSAQAELAQVEETCRTATRAHLQRMAAVMAPAEGERFLALVLPKISSPHSEAPCGIR